MDTFHARYPFLDAAREAVGAAGVDLATLVREDRTVVERGRERVELALVGGTVRTDQHVTPRVEVLSYPIARVIVSLLDVPGAVEKYAAAEASTAYERFTDEFEGRSTLGGSDLSLDDFLCEFDLADDVRETADGHRVAVGTYLRLAPSGPEWALVRRSLADGTVAVTRAELYELLREACEERVASGLPFEVPDPIADPLEPTVRRVTRSLSSRNYPRSFDAAPTPDAFPPCVEHLLAEARAGADLPAHSRFALITFLAGVGMDEEEIVETTGREEESFAYAVERLAGEGGPFDPPGCTTMQALGDCVNPDTLCESIAHPLEYYAERLD
ncbi:DNA primase large subunit PriL [Halomarina pelagica]|uniref:DNA primase large subunit PriL n=1 Tax=Halomarina pelagica TaxID=2961599 RepID=UPI0020C256B2|nr:DNA primase large subunit PriL [Halomarina sp. BND7]